MAVSRKKPASRIVEQKLDLNAERAQNAISKAREEIARSKKLVHKTFAVRDKARAVRQKKLA